ncbi:hypothetical protein NITHO_7050001 [Nitrolancea hollandica Lb]|uniref:Uncharacterized protein n=1 Tax=Nitrolancea hollandica Lb TaxID=1129897 RepID=I4EN14_9BACT|nr:hypothetical protein NITHO_7050001 [Nitrolancea hollandica Lb]
MRKENAGRFEAIAGQEQRTAGIGGDHSCVFHWYKNYRENFGVPWKNLEVNPPLLIIGLGFISKP